MTDASSTRGKPVIGLVYLLVVASLIGLSVAVYTKSMPWQNAVEVDLVTRSSGLELNPQSDVKLKGIVVGEVSAITSNGQHATVHLRLDRDRARLVPADVDASIVPKTLFGEKYVNLAPKSGGSASAATPIASGAVISPTSKAVEISELYMNLEGVLRTLRPDQLSLALGSLAEAMRGRGGQLGETVERLNTYLAGLNPRLPTLVRDVRQLAATADGYADAAPGLLRVLDNAAAFSTDLLISRQQPLAEFLTGTTDSARELTDLVRRSGPSVVGLTEGARGPLELLARYSAELPCLVDTLNTANAATNHVLGGQGPHLTATIDLLVQQPPYRFPRDLPSNPTSAGHNDRLPVGVPSWAPHCPVIPSQLRGLHDVGPYQLDSRGPVAPAKPDARPPLGQGNPAGDTARLLHLPFAGEGQVSGR